MHRKQNYIHTNTRCFINNVNTGCTNQVGRQCCSQGEGYLAVHLPPLPCAHQKKKCVTES